MQHNGRAVRFSKAGMWNRRPQKQDGVGIPAGSAYRAYQKRPTLIRIGQFMYTTRRRACRHCIEVATPTIRPINLRAAGTRHPRSDVARNTGR
jgi:hypothetical protein